MGPNKSLVPPFGVETYSAGGKGKADFLTSPKSQDSTTNENYSQESSLRIRQTSMVANCRLLFKYGRCVEGKLAQKRCPKKKK